MEFVNTGNWITAIVTLAVFLILYILSEKRRNKTLKSLLSDDMMPKLVSSACGLRRHWRSILFLISWVLIAFCLMRPFSGTDFETRRQSTRDILVLLDISNSMNVIDCYGESRLTYSKKTLMKLSNELPTDRFGLIAFSGIPFLEMPLTSDSFSFEQALQETDSNNIPYGGTNIEYALKKAESEFKEGADHKAVILISDGEEISGSTEQIVKTLVEKKIKVITVQTGDERKSGTVRNAAGTPMRKRSGELITSKAEGTVLQNLADETGGTYVAFNPGSHNRDQLITIKGEIESMTASEGENDTVEKPREIFQPFLLAAIILLIIRLFLGERKRQLQSVAILLLAFSVSLRAQNTPPVTLPQNQPSLNEKDQKRFDTLKSAEPALRQKVDDKNLDDDLKALAWYNLGINLAEQHQINPVEVHCEDIDEKAPVETQEGSFSKAESAFANALGYVGDNKKIEAATIHNKGALYHREARNIFLKDPDAAINFLKEASSSYRAALVLNPGDIQSRKNLELSYIHRKEAEIVLEIKELHDEAKKSTGVALSDIRKWTEEDNKTSLQKKILNNTSKASQAVVKAAAKAKSIDQAQMQELYIKVESLLQKGLSEIVNFEKSENRKRAEINTAEAYKLLGGNPDQPEQEQNQNDNENKEQDKNEQNPEDQNENQQKDPKENPENKGDENKSNDDPKENNPKENNPDNKPEDGENPEDRKGDNKLKPEDQKGDFNKENSQEQKSQAEEQKQASVREAEALLRKMEKEEKKVREALRNERARDIIREMRRQGIYVPPESNK